MDPRNFGDTVKAAKDDEACYRAGGFAVFNAGDHLYRYEAVSPDRFHALSPTPVTTFYRVSGTNWRESLP